MKIAAALTLAVLVTACGGHGKIVRDEQLHALMADDINALMARVNVLVFDQNRTVDELDRQRQRDALQLAETADQLSAAANRIASLLPQLNLNQADRVEFLNLARLLGEHAEGVAESVRQQDLRRAEQLAEQMATTCTACHRLYRGF
ncbi:hypothetical protein [Pseudohongiella spirulinae]|uniref:Cytochrome C n=1 Tax=Pseudohongiella spirulinae TaxID=1249552 RepID=A0A0S2KGN1_9GAMM|nr:hypothetical protein [Pseudohongiella spirulinae]ALO47484.1 hypothetical protein PS2015_2855 [Pseudohongiella spirulinae]